MVDFNLSRNIEIPKLYTIVSKQADAVANELETKDSISQDDKLTLSKLSTKGYLSHFNAVRLTNNGYSPEEDGFNYFKSEALENIFRLHRVLQADQNDLFSSKPQEIQGLAGSKLNTDEQKLIGVFNCIDSLLRINKDKKLKPFKDQFPEQTKAITTVLEQLKIDMDSFINDLRISDLNIPKSLIKFIAKRWSLDENTSKPTISPQAVISSSNEGDTFLPVATLADAISSGTDSFS